MKKTSKKVNVLKHFNDQFDARVKKFMDGGTAGVVNNYNDIKYGTGGANPGTGKSYMSGNPAPAFKKGGMKRYQDGSQTGPKSDPAPTPVSNTPMSKEDFKKAKQARRQANKLERISKRGSGVNIDKVAKVAGAIGAGVAAASGIKNLFKKNSGSGPGLKKGGFIKSKKK